MHVKPVEAQSSRWRGVVVLRGGGNEKDSQHQVTIPTNSSTGTMKSKKGLRYPLCCSFRTGGAITYQLLHHSINRQVAKNDANLPLSTTLRYVPIETPLYSKRRSCWRISQL
ncbi:hypothetical protein TNCV_4431331 [Trichonephila clavipes]|nr:hypothetical protein TNCV_4431331 [Trichonephila clavipes]